MNPQSLPTFAPARVLALGAWLKNTACLLSGFTAWHSPLHGDLSDPASRLALAQSADTLLAQARQHALEQGRQDCGIDAIAHDLHPDFYSTQLAQNLAAQLGVPAIAVQHHHAHIALMQAEQGFDVPLVGWALDGVGLGTDGTAWGGELLVVSGASCARLDHLPTLLLPGGDIAAKEPPRMAAAVRHYLGLDASIEPPLLRQMITKGLNCPRTTSAGRWFDAVAGVLGLCDVQTEEAQAAITLERLASKHLDTHGPILLDSELIEAGLDFAPLMRRIIQLANLSTPHATGEAAALFHIALAHALAQQAVAQAHQQGTRHIALGGGCFFNAVLRKATCDFLGVAGFAVHLPEQARFGDAGLALGQAWAGAQNFVATHRALTPAVISKFSL